MEMVIYTIKYSIPFYVMLIESFKPSLLGCYSYNVSAVVSSGLLQVFIVINDLGIAN